MTNAAPEIALPHAAQLESLLFVADRPLTVEDLQCWLGVAQEEVERALQELAEQYQGRGLALQRHGDAVQLVTNPGAAPLVQRFLGLQTTSKLSAAAVETLAIIAYRQPVTRGQIEALRGVNCERALATLVARALVQQLGRLETVGRPILYSTTFEFLQAFGLTGLAELPSVANLPADGRTDP